MNNIIELRGISKVYQMGEHQVRALDRVNLEVSAGQFIAIMGPSGSGKSTFMHILGCLDRPTEGEYILEHENVARLPKKALAALRRSKIGFVFQAFHLLPDYNVLHNVELTMLYDHVPRKERIRRSLEILDELKIKDRAMHKPTELSGGEMQRVAIARALLNNPVLLLADEPTGNLDTRTGSEIMEIFHRLHREGKTIIMVTHDPSLAQKTDKIVYIQDGKIKRHDSNSIPQPAQA